VSPHLKLRGGAVQAPERVGGYELHVQNAKQSFRASMHPSQQFAIECQCAVDVQKKELQLQAAPSGADQPMSPSGAAMKPSSETPME
jgi:hypothetical protein